MTTETTKPNSQEWEEFIAAQAREAQAEVWLRWIRLVALCVAFLGLVMYLTGSK